jgi:hypothetical protein
MAKPIQNAPSAATNNAKIGLLRQAARGSTEQAGVLLFMGATQATQKLAAARQPAPAIQELTGGEGRSTKGVLSLELPHACTGAVHAQHEWVVPESPHVVAERALKWQHQVV